MAADATPARTDNPNALPPGTRLGEFELLSVLGVGGFGIVYLAFDHALEREVAIKEYMPATLAGRTETMHVSLRSHSDAETFALGLRSFVNEAKLLARFDHPSLLKVHRFWESNGTAYMAMPVLRGRNIKSIRGEMGGPPDEAWLRSVLMPLLGAIETLHQEGVYHRDIAPDNIQIEPDGRPVLLDFGAARRVLSDKSQALTAILKPAYAPIEQYGEAGSVKQGPWTDLYALGATLHYVLLGRPPAPATARALDDEASGLTVQALPGCSASFLHAIDWMLCPRPADRPQSVAALREVLEGRAPLPRRAGAEQPTQPWERTDILPGPAAGGVDLDVGPPPADATQVSRPGKPASTAAPAPAAAAAAPATTAWHQPRPQPRRPVTEVDLDTGFGESQLPAGEAGGPELHLAADAAPPAPPNRSRVPMVLAAVLAAAAVAAFLFWPRPVAGPVAAPTPAASAPLATVPAPAAASAPEAPAPAPAPASAAAPATATAAPAGAASTAAAGPVPPTPTPTPAPEAARPESTVQPVTVPAAPAARPERAAPRPTEPRPAEPRPRPEAAKPATRPAAEPVPATPGPACGPREGVRYHLCMGRECAQPEFAAHPSCQRWKAEAKPE